MQAKRVRHGGYGKVAERWQRRRFGRQSLAAAAAAAASPLHPVSGELKLLNDRFQRAFQLFGAGPDLQTGRAIVKTAALATVPYIQVAVASFCLLPKGGAGQSRGRAAALAAPHCRCLPAQSPLVLILQSDWTVVVHDAAEYRTCTSPLQGAHSTTDASTSHPDRSHPSHLVAVPYKIQDMPSQACKLDSSFLNKCPPPLAKEAGLLCRWLRAILFPRIPHCVGNAPSAPGSPQSPAALVYVERWTLWPKLLFLGSPAACCTLLPAVAGPPSRAAAESLTLIVCWLAQSYPTHTCTNGRLAAPFTAWLACWAGCRVGRGHALASKHSNSCLQRGQVGCAGPPVRRVCRSAIEQARTSQMAKTCEGSSGCP